MFLFGVLCLVATTIALPLELPPAPEAFITVPESELRTNMPPVNDFDIKNEEAKDNSKEAEDKVFVILNLPEPPQLPPMHQSIREYLDKEMFRSRKSNQLSPDAKDGEGEKLRIIESRLPSINYPSVDAAIEILNA